MYRNLCEITEEDIKKSAEKIMELPLICIESDIERISDDLAKLHCKEKSNIGEWVKGIFDNYNLDE